MADYAKIIEELEGIAVEDNPALVKQKEPRFLLVFADPEGRTR